MEAVGIHTSQNVIIDYEPAGLGNRLLAAILDLLFKIGFLIALSIIYGFFGYFFDRSGSSTSLVVYYSLFLIPYIFYDFLFETFMHGQTIGKKILKIKVVKLDGTQPSVGSYLLRWLIRLLEIDICQGLIAMICIATSKNSQRLGDMAAGTTVIRVKQSVTLRDTILQKQEHEAYSIVFKQVALLNDADVQLMKDVHDFFVKTEHSDALEKLVIKIKAKTGIETDLDDDKLIATLLKDYNYYQLEK